MENKITNAKAMDMVLAMVNGEEVEVTQEFIDKLTKIRASFDTKRKPTATQLLNKKLEPKILEFMEDGVRYSVTDIMDAFEEIGSNQKATHLLSSLVDNGLVNRGKDKGKSYYTKA